MRRWLHILLPLAILGLAVTLRLSEPVAVVNLRNMVFDTFQRIKPRAYTPMPVRIIDLDDASLEKLGQWPWPRTMLAEMVARLTNMGAAVIVFDIVFAEADRTSPRNILPLWPEVPELEALRTAAEGIPDHDRIFGEVIAQAPVVTGFVLTDGEISRKPAVKGTFAFAGDNPKPFVLSFSGAVATLPEIEEGASGNGSFNMVPDPDGIVRRVPMIMRLGDEFYPSIVAEAVRVAQGAKTYIVKSSGASGEESYGEHTGINNIKIGNLVVPTDGQGSVYANYTESSPERYVPVWQIFDESVDPSLIEGNILFVGTSAAGLKDQRATPLNPVVPGVEIHAQLTEQIILEMAGGEASYLERPDWASGAEIVYLVGLGLLMIVLLPRWGALWSAVFGVGMVTGAIASSWYVFSSHGWLLDPIFPSTIALIIYIVESLVTYLRTEAEKNQVRGAFAHYLSPALVEQLAENPDQLTLGGETREMTLLFCDIRGFTTISEQFDAHGLTSFINRFLTPMTEIILSNRGTIDKYMGDAIMAFWNAPLQDQQHAYNACRAALNMTKELKNLNKVWEETALVEGRNHIPVKVGIGLNSGPCCVGNLGSDQRFDYSVLGDDVNLASRLEGQSKTYGVNIVIGENTRNMVEDMAALELDLIQVKGKTVPVQIFTLLGDEVYHDMPSFQKLRGIHGQMLEAYRTQNWDAAIKLIEQCLLAADGELRGLYKLYVERIEECRVNPPGPDWDGVYVATSK